jgi:hypothetical protein
LANIPIISDAAGLASFGVAVGRRADAAAIDVPFQSQAYVVQHVPFVQFVPFLDLLGMALRGKLQQPEARLTPRELNAHIEQGIGTSAGTGKLHDRHDTVSLSRSEGHGSASAVMRAGIDT